MKKRICCITIALCTVLCIVFTAGCSKTAKSNTILPEVRNNGTAIQWKYSDETDWRDLVALAELRGAAGEAGKDGADGKNGVDGINGINGKDGINGIDGKDGADGKDGINAKNIEVQRAESYIQWRYEGDEWQNLVAIADITGPAGQKGADGANGKTPEFRVSENTLQWRYVGDEVWLNMYDLSVLKGLDGRDGADGKDGINGKDGIDGKDGAAGKDGTNGINGSDGADGNTPFIGENGNWWIGETDTGVKAAGIDGADGVDGEKGDKGDKGDPGEKGDKGDPGEKGDKGDAGQNGGSSGYFYGTGYVPSTHLSDGAVPLYYREMHNRGGIISYNGTTLRLKKGHTYNVCVSGMVNAQTNDNSGKHSVRMTDGYDDDYCRYITLIEQDSRGSNSLCFNRIYDLTGAKNDVELKFSLEQGDYKTYLLSFRGSVTITALD